MNTNAGGSLSSSGKYSLDLSVSFTSVLPLSDHTAPVIVISLSVKIEATATGAEQPPPRVFKKDRSQTHLSTVFTSFSGSKMEIIFLSDSRHSTPKAPCPTAYKASSGSNI